MAKNIFAVFQERLVELVGNSSLNAHHLKDIQSDLDNQAQWQAFVTECQMTLEKAIFMKEFETDTLSLPLAKLEELKDRPSIATIVGNELERRAMRKEVRKAFTDWVLQGEPAAIYNEYWKTLYYLKNRTFKKKPDRDAYNHRASWFDQWMVDNLCKPTLHGMSQEEQMEEAAMWKAIARKMFLDHYDTWLVETIKTAPCTYWIESMIRYYIPKTLEAIKKIGGIEGLDDAWTRGIYKKAGEYYLHYADNLKDTYRVQHWIRLHVTLKKQKQKLGGDVFGLSDWQIRDSFVKGLLACGQDDDGWWKSRCCYVHIVLNSLSGVDSFDGNFEVDDDTIDLVEQTLLEHVKDRLRTKPLASVYWKGSNHSTMYKVRNAELRVLLGLD